MPLTEKDVRYVAELAHLELTAEEVSKFLPQLDSILQYIDKLNKLIREAVASEAYRNLLKITLAVRFPCSPEELAAFQAKETVKRGEIVRISGMQEP